MFWKKGFKPRLSGKEKKKHLQVISGFQESTLWSDINARKMFRKLTAKQKKRLAKVDLDRINKLAEKRFEKYLKSVERKLSKKEKEKLGKYIFKAVMDEYLGGSFVG